MRSPTELKRHRCRRWSTTAPCTSRITGDAYFVTGTGPYGALVTNSTLPEPENKKLDLYSLGVRWLAGAVQASAVTSWSRSYADFGFDATVGNGQYYPSWSGAARGPGLASPERALTLRKLSEEVHVNRPRAGVSSGSWPVSTPRKRE